ncbi:MAG TPA: glycosyltransferase [Puia sp.]|nr:glycosyltransferase [Puia sp.]
MLKVLVAPLDWGLGHATRCIPIIKELINQGCTVIIAAGGAQKALLQKEFPDLSFVGLPGFRLKYGKNRAFTLLKIIFALPKILIGIKQENAWLQQFTAREGLDAVISDNRYGLHGAGVFAVFITHQLAIRSSLGAAVDWLLRRANYAYIRQFSVCWVPDVEGVENLAGVLSHPSRLPAIPVRYIGWLSRLEVVEVEETVDLLILLSGPEPQRSILEQLLIRQLDENLGRIVLVRGLPKGGAAVKAPNGVVVFDHLGTRELERVICQSRLVLARSGYSTVMDLVRLRRRTVYIPTPGQPDQEYLGRYLEEKGFGICMRQRGFLLKEAMDRARGLSNRKAAARNEVLREEIRTVLAQSGAAPLIQ